MRKLSGRLRLFGAFGVKDLFTMINLVAGVVAIRFTLEGELRRAGFAVFVGFVGGDLLDGVVARRTGTANRFGAEFDAITDHFVHIMVPALVIYRVYELGHHAWLGLCLVAALIASATIRHARLAVSRFDFPLCWCG